MNRRSVSVYLTTDERTRLIREAEMFGMSLSAYLRWKAMQTQMSYTGTSGAGQITWSTTLPSSSVDLRETK